MKWVYVVYRNTFNSYESDSRTEVLSTENPHEAMTELTRLCFMNQENPNMEDYVLTYEEREA